MTDHLPLRARGSVVREPRLAFNAAEEDCCSCINSKPWVCDLRGDGICRCFPLAPDRREESGHATT